MKPVVVWQGTISNYFGISKAPTLTVLESIIIAKITDIITVTSFYADYLSN